MKYGKSKTTTSVVQTNNELPVGFEEITKEEYEKKIAELNPPYVPTPEEIKAQRISELEAQLTPRRLREASLHNKESLDFVQNIENEIAELAGREAISFDDVMHGGKLGE